MQVLALTNLFPNPLYPTRAPFVFNQLKAMSVRHGVRVISPIACTEEWRARWKGRSGLNATRAGELGGIQVDYPRYWFTPGLLRKYYGRFFYHSVRSVFHRVAKEFKPDVVFTSWAYPDGWAAVKLAREIGRPVVLKVHGSDVLLLKDNVGRRGPTLEALCSADGVIAVSQDLAERMVEMGVDRDKIKVIYDGVDRDIFFPGSREDARKKLGIERNENVVLFIGNLVPVKAVDNLLHACKYLKDQGTPFKLRIIGQGPLRKTLETMSKTLHIDQQVQFVGVKPQAELGDWYRAANLFTLSSKSEGVPCVLVESSACGIPYVSTRVGGIPEIAAWGEGTLVPANDAISLGKAMQTVLCQANRGPATSVFTRTQDDASQDQEAYLEQVLAQHRLKHSSASALASS